MKYARISFLRLLVAAIVLAFPTAALATNYITAQGVQNFSITINSGSLTGTATVNAVGSGGFILFEGLNPSASSNFGEQMAWLTLTNPTTITATRATSTTGTVTIKGNIVDGDTTNLIKSVQYGTVTIPSAGASGTATISPVTDANTAVHFLGQTVAASAISERQDLAALSLSGTTVTAAVALTVPANETVSFEIIEFQSTPLTANAVQRISATSSSSVTSYTKSLTNNVVLNNSLSIYGGSSIATATTNLSQGEMYGSLTGVGTFTVNINTATTDAKTYNASIVEFNSGVLNSAVQRSTTTLTGATSNTSTITGVTAANSCLSYLNQTCSVTTALLDQCKGAAVLTNGTTVTVTKTTATSNITGSWEVAEFPAFAAANSVGDAIWFGSAF